MGEERRLALQRLKVLSLDVDGVLTDGGLYYTDTGAELRRFDVQDGHGLQRVLASGVQVVMISASTTPAIAARAERLGVSDVLLGVQDKATALPEWCAARDVPLDAVAHMADDENDLALLRLVGLAIAPANAVAAVLDAAHWVTARGGGAGAVREVCDEILGARVGTDLRSV